MSRYLTADEMADRIGCAPTSFACMWCYLTRDTWSFEPNIRGFPQVSRDYHDARMAGSTLAGAAIEQVDEPDFSMFEAT